MSRLRDQYENEIKDAMVKKFGYKNVMEIPKLDKVVVNMGVGEAKENAKILEAAMGDMEIITGQKPIATRSKNSIANFKIREGMPIGCKVTLRSEKMYEFAKNYGCLVNGNTAQEFANPRIFAQTHNQRAERLSDEELYNFYMNVNELHGRGGMHCSAGMSEIGIKANGIVVPCITWRNCELGSILKEDLSVILQSNQTCKVREYDYSRLKCAKCEHLPYCDPCPMVFSYETGDEYIPATESCRIACVRHRVQDLRRIE